MRKLLLLTIFCPLFSGAQIVLKPQIDSIPMRDGKMLAADVYLPDTGQKYPVILIQTPYNRLYYRAGLPLKIGKNLQNSPYAFVIVDWRCFYGSASACKANPDRGKDGYDVIDWIAKQPWSNGKVGTWGPSALGKIQYQTAREQHPAHICAVPIVAGSQFEYQEYFPNGVFRTEYVDQLDALGYNMKTSLLQHPYYDVYWQYVENANMYPDKIKIPMFLIGGWFDHNIDLMFHMFDTLVKASDTTVRDLHKFLVGPWSHNTVGQKKVGELEFPEAEGASDSFALLFFDYWLRGAKNGWPLNEKYLLYEMSFGNGTSCHLTRSDKWPLSTTPKNFLFLHENMLIGNRDSALSTITSKSFLYDPKNPSPTIGGPALKTDLLQGPWSVGTLCQQNDNYLLDKIYPPLGAFQGIYIQGSPEVVLYVSSIRLDTDFAIRFGYINTYSKDTIILSDGIFRMRFRDGYTVGDTQLLTPGNIYPIKIKLPEILCSIIPPCFPFLLITSSNYPRFDMNLNNGKVLYASGDTLTALNSVYTGRAYPSAIIYNGNIIIEGFEKTTMHTFEIYPNPVSEKIIIQPKNLLPPFTFTLSDLQGKILMQGEKSNLDAFSIDVSGLDPQVYMMKFYNREKCFVQKIVKLK